MRTHFVAPISLLFALSLVGPACESGSSTATGGSTPGEAGAGGTTGSGTTSSTVHSTTGHGSGGALSCDGTPETWCGHGSYCEAPGDACAGAGVPGTCAPRPDDCTEPAPTVVCGCNGQVYASACLAQYEGVDVGPQAACSPPAKPFACGGALCEDGVQYCESINGAHKCKPLPTGCTAPETTCECLSPVFCVAAPGMPMCSQDTAGHFLVNCQVTE